MLAIANDGLKVQSITAERIKGVLEWLGAIDTRRNLLQAASREEIVKLDEFKRSAAELSADDCSAVRWRRKVRACARIR